MDARTSGLGSWWNKFDKLLLRKYTPEVLLERSFVEHLNDYFAQVCHDPEYEEPLKMDINAAFKTPQLDHDQVYNILISIMRTATGSDKIPYWIWKDFANILFPVAMKVWNMSLSTSMWCSLWKTANINPIPKVEILGGINITLVIARTFERMVYELFSKETFESGLNSNQFANRKGGCCVDALLKIQHFNLKAFDNNLNKTVRVFTMDFSKAFDSVRITYWVKS